MGNNFNFNLSNLSVKLLPDAKILGNKDFTISKFMPFHLAKPGCITYALSSKIGEKQNIISNNASVFITDIDLSDKEDDLLRLNKTIILTKYPRLQMAKIAALFCDYEHDLAAPKIHPSAFIGNNVSIGSGSVIGSCVFINDNVIIGKNCNIMHGSVIGSDGFGYEKDLDGSWFKIPHIGSVIIGDNVDIGANTCIDRGTIGNTIIGNDVKIDNLVHIAHNVKVGDGSFIIANAMVAGSCEIGKFTWVAPSSSIREGISVGDGSIVGMGSVVTKSVQPNTTVMGVPAREKE